MKDSILYSIIKGRCPVCHEGVVFEKKNLYKLNKFDKMPENCSHCGHKFEIEAGFWYGSMFISYALTVAFSIVTFVLTYLIYPKATAWVYIFTIAICVILLAPISYRLSRMIWMNLFSHFDPLKATKHEQV